MYKCILFLLVIASGHLNAQYAESIRSGRPGQAIGAFTVGKDLLQVQSGITFNWADYSIPTLKSNAVVSSTVIRFGLTETFEVSTVLGFSNYHQDFEGQSSNSKGLSTAQFGFRFNIRDGRGSGPNIGIQSRLKLPVLSKDFNQKGFANTTKLSLTQKLGVKYGLTTNLGVNWYGNGASTSGIYVLNLSRSISSKSSIFIENYGSLSNGDVDTRFDTGFDYVINSNLKLDFSAGLGSNEGVKDYFIDFGFSWRTLTKKRAE